MNKAERHLSYWPAEKWVKNWEDCAGRPHVKNTIKPGRIKGIHEIVSDWQDILARMGKTLTDDIRFREWYPTYGALDEETYSQGMPAQYPQSLGELCLELAGSRLRGAHHTIFGFWIELPPAGRVTPSYFYPEGVRRDIQKLREIMYRKHTSLERERYEQARDYFKRLYVCGNKFDNCTFTSTDTLDINVGSAGTK